MRTPNIKASSISEKPKVFIHLLIVMILATVPMLWYGNKLISPVSLDLQTNPVSFLKTVFYAWQSQQALGTSLNAPGWIFPSGAFFSILSLVSLPGFLAVRLWYISLSFLAGAAMYFYAVSILKNYATEIQGERLKSQNNIATCALVAAIGYMANPYVVMHLINGHFLIPYSVLPLQLLILDKGLRSGRLYFAVLLALISVLVTTNLPIVAISYVVMFLYIAFYFMTLNKKVSAQQKRFVIISFFLIALNLLWYVIPMALPLFNSDAVLAGAISEESWKMYGRHSSFSETFRLLGVWPLYSGGYEFSNYYVNTIIGIVATYLLPVIAVCSFIFMRRSPFFIFLLLLLLFSIFMAVGGHASSPFKGIYVFLYDHVPLFSMFRNGYKFVGIIAFTYVVLISTGLFFLLNHKSVAKKKASVALSLSVAILFIASALPLFRGQLFGPAHQAQIPSYWHDAAKWLDNKQGLFRILLLPDQYFATYKWGGYAGFFSSAPYLLHDVISNSSTKSGNEVIQMLYSPLSQRLNTSTRKFDGNVPDEDFCKIIRALSIEYIVQRNDIDYTIYKVSSPSMVKRFLGRRDCVRFSRTFGQVDIYEVVGESLPRFYLANGDALAKLELGEIR